MASILEALDWPTTRSVLHPIDRIARRLTFPSTGCWEWVGAKNNNGYGHMTICRTGRPYATFTIHRALFELHEGPISDGLTLDHLCMNRPCANPAHLEPVTFIENIRRRNAAA